MLSNPEIAAAIAENRLSLTHIIILLEFVSRLVSSGCNSCLLLGSTDVVAGGGVAGEVHPLGDFALARML
jgi:hypothetical protein